MGLNADLNIAGAIPAVKQVEKPSIDRHARRQAALIGEPAQDSAQGGRGAKKTVSSTRSRATSKALKKEGKERAYSMMIRARCTSSRR